MDGDWHEFESKALRKENEKKDKESRRLQKEAQASKTEKEKKRGIEGDAVHSEAKRVQMDPDANATKVQEVK